MKLHILIGLTVFLWLAVSLPAQVSAPKLGLLRYADGTVRPVYGVQANLVVGKRMFRGAEAVSFSDAGGLIAENRHIHLIARNGTVVRDYNAGDRKALLNIDGDLTTAIAYLPSREALLRWGGRSFVLTRLDTGNFGGTVTSVEVSGPHAARLLITTRQQNVAEVTVSLETGQLISFRPLPGVRGPAFLNGGFVVSRDEEGLEVETAKGVRRTIPLHIAGVSDDLKCERMSAEWFHITSLNRQEWVLHLSGTTFELSELPVALDPGDGK